MTDITPWPKRCFLGFALTDVQQQQITQWQQALNESSVRWVPQANLHLTLAFLGQLRPEHMAQLMACVPQLTRQRFRQPLTQLAYWPQPKIGCITATTVAPALQQLADAAQQLMQQLALPSSEHSVYRPHITLARKANSLAEAWPQLPSLQLTLQPSALHLYQSQSGDSGVSYSILHRWPLL
ncbi:RNA 2',3'-cyclic phosphodiesterase [Shewanella sp.]|uniref:RNA 2',3'-cyclic phosphodiesterase n=1 Tax=Shewanella sp. TaxID=50422 RepID=UPI003A97137B